MRILVKFSGRNYRNSGFSGIFFYYESKQYFRPCVNEFKISFWALLQKGKWEFFRGGGDLNHSERFEAVDGHRATVETII